MKTRIQLGISPCPNDTFVFHALLQHKIETVGLELSIEIADVEELNRRWMRGELDAGKASFFAALLLASETVVLPAGSALGFGVGPLLLAARGRPPVIDRSARVLCPGEWTTAHLLLRLFHPGEGAVSQVLFSDILPALERGEADYGVCIHEGRFTWQGRGLQLVEDLGATFERRLRSPLPLGGILARRTLPPAPIASLVRAIRQSLDYARAHRAEALSTMKQHAQELSEDVLWSHVDLYVNEWTRDLGDTGRTALDKLSVLARESGSIGRATPALEVFDGSDEPPLNRRSATRSC